MSSTVVPYRLFVGIDIVAASASVACATDPRTVAPAFTIAQTPAGFADLATRLQRRHLPAAAVLVVLEATNTYGIARSICHATRASLARRFRTAETFRGPRQGREAQKMLFPTRRFCSWKEQQHGFSATAESR